MNVTEEVTKIRERNIRVEAEKAWETSFTRVSIICLITYTTTALVFAVIGVKQFLLNAFIPTVGFFISTLSLTSVKSWWVNRRLEK